MEARRLDPKRQRLAGINARFAIEFVSSTPSARRRGGRAAALGGRLRFGWGRRCPDWGTKSCRHN
jgi:hypothetical protein